MRRSERTSCIYMRYSGPASVTEQDGSGELELPPRPAATGVIANAIRSTTSMVAGKVSTDAPVPGNVSVQVSRREPRQFYRRWRDYYAKQAPTGFLLGRRTKGAGELRRVNMSVVIVTSGTLRLRPVIPSDWPAAAAGRGLQAP